MDKLLKGDTNPVVVGLGQSLAVAIYCALVGAFMFYVENQNTEPGYLGVLLILVLFVFSAAVTGTLVFGLPVYLSLKNKFKEALSILGYTLLFSFIIILVIIIVLFSTVLS